MVTVGGVGSSSHAGAGNVSMASLPAPAAPATDPARARTRRATATGPQDSARSSAQKQCVQRSLTILTGAAASICICHRWGLGKIRHLAVADLWVQDMIKTEHVDLRKALGKPRSKLYADQTCRCCSNGAAYVHHGPQTQRRLACLGATVDSCTVFGRRHAVCQNFPLFVVSSQCGG